MKILFLLGLFCFTVFAKDYALIVTIGKYEKINALVGAHQDNVTYREMLKRWGVSNIVSLEDSEATKKNILYHLEDISNKIENHDRFFMFFSGHGSSLYDNAYSMKFQKAGLTEKLRDSAAIFPYDFDPDDIGKFLIVGKTDLRAYLEKIDAKIRAGLIVFDACYSEQAIRSDRIHKQQTPHILTSSKGYPYANIIYIASSIAEAESGKFSVVLQSCLDKVIVVEDIRECINRKMNKSVQIPIVLTK